jgi:amino-acid N-acetyltransferase
MIVEHQPIGFILRELRKEKSLTLSQVAALAGTDSGNLSRMERGQQNISEAFLHKLCTILGCSPAYVFQKAQQNQHHDAEKYAYNAYFQSKEPLTDPSPHAFVSWFRSVAPYIHAFGGKTFVIAFGGEVVHENQFLALSHDLNLLASLDVRLVLVHGARPQIETRLKRAKHKTSMVAGRRVTDDKTMSIVMEANGAIRLEIEALLSMGLANSPMAGSDIRVASGNFITAKPLGIRDGVDLQHTGEVRKVDAMGIQKRLDDGEMVLLSPLGYSLTGEAFNLSLEDVAVNAAIALDADKLIFLMDSPGVFNIRGELLREMTSLKAQNLLQHLGNVAEDSVAPFTSEDVGYYLPAAIKACEHGVARTHLICRHTDGAILQELFTHAGIGTMITEMPLESTRQATLEDIAPILRLIEPLEEAGILLRRGREQVEKDIDYFYVMEHDNRIIGCAALYPYFEENMAEFACFAMHPDYRGGGRGDRLIHHCEAQARQMGMNALFCLTTHTGQWFLEHGFVEKKVDDLPVLKRNKYNEKRRSKVFMKSL